MATQKPSKPSVSLPDNFGGVKTAYTTTQIENGYQDGVPEVVDGGNINYEKDGIFQKLKYVEAVADVINNIPANRYLGVDSNNRFEYYDASTRNSYGNIGDIKYSMRTDVPYGGAWCDGTMYTKTQLPDLYDMLVNGDLQTVTISEYESQISSNGVCGFFGLDTSNKRFKVPTLKDIYIKTADANLAEFGAENSSGTSGGLEFIKYRAYVVTFTAVEDSTEATWNLKEDKSNKVQDLTSPSETTYPSTQAVANESNRIISIMDNNFGHSLKANTSAAINISNPYTASTWGWVLYKGMSNNKGIYIAINDVPICNGLDTGVSPTAVVGSFILAPGDKFSHNGVSTSLMKFIPLYES